MLFLPMSPNQVVTYLNKMICCNHTYIKFPGKHFPTARFSTNTIFTLFRTFTVITLKCSAKILTFNEWYKNNI